MAAFMRKWADEKPEPLERICVTDKDGKHAGGTYPVVWDGKHLATTFAYRLGVDENNLDEWCYYDEVC